MQDSDLLVTSYTPLAHGKINGNDIIVSIAKKYGRTPAQITLQWLLHQKNVSAIPKAGSKIHLQENLEALNFEIKKEDAEAITTITN